tara:strand:- start:23749 stop:24645 length:897 start_codon:yes stop_codon:yes gene_type:complete
MSFANLKRNRQTDLDKLTNELQKTQTTRQSYDDDRIWKPERDKSGNGYAVVRFLPQSEGEDIPWVRMFSHGFQGPGGWYIENSRTTINQPDPVSEFNTSLWNNGTEQGKEQARKQKRKLQFISNIYVITDPANPQNEGKVFLYKYGKKIFDKIQEAMNPEFEDEVPINPFDFWVGADFKIKIRTLDGFVNYDRSEFDPPSKLMAGDDSKLEEIYNQQHSLIDLIAEDKFKSYDELKEKFERIMGFQSGTDRVQFEAVEETIVEELPKTKDASDFQLSKAPELEDDDNMSYFQKLANEV